MESPPRLGLGTINIAPLCGRTNLTTRVWVRSLGMGMENHDQNNVFSLF